MAGFNVNTTVSQQEAETLKEIIFKRARERSNQLAEETKKSYTGSVKSDIMDLARTSLEKEHNPFAKIISSEGVNGVNGVNEIKEAKEIKDETPAGEIGFAQRSVKDIHDQIINKNQDINRVFTDREVEKAMMSARADYKKSASFMGALEFLNSQATISLVNSRGKSFDAIA